MVVAWAVAVVLFAVKLPPATVGRVLNLLLALGAFGLLYAHTGQLALSIGVHTGVNFASTAVFAPAPDGFVVFVVSASHSGPAGSLATGAIPQIALASVLVLGWLAWRRDGVGLATDLARWSPG